MRRILVIAVLALALALGLALGVALAFDGGAAQASPTPGNYVQLPVLGYIGNTKAGVDWTIEAQNVGSTWTKIALLLFAENSGFCQPQAQNPFKIECTGLLKPGTSWVWTSSQLPSSAKSAIAISYNPFPQQGNEWWRCEQWTTDLNTRRWPEGWPSVTSTPGQFPFNWNPFYGQPIAVEVVRKMPGNATPSFVMADAYSGLSAMQEGRYDPIFGGFAYYAPVAYSGYNGWNSWLYIQNSGAECTSVELWFKAQDDWLVIGAANDHLFAALCAALGAPGLCADPRYRSMQSRLDNHTQLKADIEAALSSASAQEWVARLTAAGIPAAPINKMPQAAQNPQIAARNMIVTLHDPEMGELKVCGNPIKISGYPDPMERPPAPNLDEHRPDILRALGEEAEERDNPKIPRAPKHAIW